MFRKWLEGVVCSVYIWCCEVYVGCYVAYTTFKVLHEEDLKLVKKYGEDYDPMCTYTSVSLSPIVVFLVFLSLYLLGGFG